MTKSQQELVEVCKPLVKRLSEEGIAIVCTDDGLNLLPTEGKIPEDVFQLMDAHHMDLLQYMTIAMRKLTNIVDQAAAGSRCYN